MGKLVVTEFVSADGVFQDPGGAGEIDRGGWSFKAERGDEFDKFKTDELMAADVQLLGRTTYEGFAKAWPEMEDTEGEFAVKMNRMPKFVVSTTLSDDDAAWENSTVIRDGLRGAVARLKDDVSGDILVTGSGQLVGTLLDEGLVDELRLMIYPIIVGEGRQLFGSQQDMSELRLKDFKTIGPDGIIVLTYVPA